MSCQDLLLHRQYKSILNMPLVSIVIPTFARPEQLSECLRALTCQTMAACDFEVVVVDDGSPQQLDAIVAGYARDLNIRLIRQANAGPGPARNRGVNEATGKWIAFTDDDCLPDPQWLELLLARERRDPGTLVGGTTINGLTNELFASTSQLIIDLVYEHFNSDPDNAYFFASNNILCEREHILELGGFDFEFAQAGGEDRDFCDRWRSSGRRLVWCKEAQIEHRHSQTLKKFLRLHYRYGKGAYSYHRKRKERHGGNMKKDLGFHASIIALLWPKLGRPMGYGKSLGIIVGFVLWQLANACGFFAQAFAEYRRGS